MLRVLLMAVLTLALAGQASAGGGFWLEFGNPSALSDPAARGSVVVVRLLGCGKPQEATVSGTAEGLVDGKRQSVPLKFIAAAQPGIYFAKEELPRAGHWVIHVVGNYQGHLTGGLGVVGAEGFARQKGKALRRPSTSAEIDAELAGMAGKRPTERVTE